MSCQGLQHPPYMIFHCECVWLNTTYLYGHNGDQGVGWLLGDLRKSRKLKGSQRGFPGCVDLNKHGCCMELPGAFKGENADMDILFL